ncbi:hypothetical protein ILUMI_17931, partial [Ignelater luminosus]
KGVKYINVRMPRRVDARVLRTSPIYNSLANIQNPLLTEHQHLTGDSAYPLMRNLFTPFRDNGHLTATQTNCKFRRLKYLDIEEPDFGTQIITSSCVLHNLILLHSEENEENDHERNIEENLERVNENPEHNRNAGMQKRNNIADLLFN